MKIKKLIFTVTSLTAMLACAAFTACNKPLQSHVQQLDYTESIARINNPDQGFYHPIYVKVTETGVTYNKYVVTEATQLYHLRIDLSAFSKAVNEDSDKPLTQAALDGLDELLSYIKGKDKNAVVRFAYDPAYGGSKDKEPALQTILRHIEQVSPVLNGYKNTVTAVEAGMIGPWGEMHTSAIAKPENITPILETFLTCTEDIPVLARTPKMIYDYLGITVNDIEDYTVPATHKAYRLGLFNDGYLGSENDLGTYTDREKEVEFLSGQTNHLPYGGEAVTPSSGLHDVDKCLPEMYKLNLSYLNVEWHSQVIDKWRNSYYTAECGSDEVYYGSTAFTYIENRMGYRFVLTNSTLGYSDKVDKIQIGLKLQNVGFGNLNRSKHASIIFADADGKVAFVKETDNFTGAESYNCSFNLNLESGAYDVYLRVYGEAAEGLPLYCLQFANDGLWNAALKANKIGSLEVK